MPSKLAVLLMVAMLSAAQTGPGPKMIRHRYKPGDALHYTVAFEGDPAFESITIYFQSPSVPPDQSGLANNFSLEHSVRVARGTFDVDGTIPANAGTGTYRLEVVQTRIGRGVKDYNAEAFNETVDVDNSARYEFPPLKSVIPD